jgi:CRISPR-associated protein Csd1
VILQSLYEYYQRKVALGSPDAAPEGFEWKAIPFLIVIDESGQFLALDDTRETLTPKGQLFLVPRAGQRSGSNSWATTNILWDHVGYLFGVHRPDSDKTKEAKNQERAKRQHETWLSSLDVLGEQLHNDRAIAAIKKFYASGQDNFVSRSPNWEECLKIPGCNVTFRLDGDTIPVPCRESIQQLALSRLGVANAKESDDDAEDSAPVIGRCLISGECAAIARLHTKTAINKDCKSFVGFQRNSGYDSYGKEQAFNAPVSCSAESAYTTALKIMLAEGSSNRVRIGDTTTLFWSDGSSQLEADFPSFWQPASKDDPDRGIRAMQTLLESPFTGANIPEGKLRFFVLGLAPGGGSRIAVRYWYAGTVAEIAGRLRHHFTDLDVVKPKHDKGNCALFFLLSDIALENKIDNIPPNIAGNTMRAILTGGPYPVTLLQQTIRRIRAKQDVRRTQAALLKACLNRASRLQRNSSQEEIQVSLDPSNNNPGYRLGRLFAVLEKIQEDAQPGINATIRDKFYGAASASPVSVFPQLLKLKNHHLAKLDNAAFRAAHERRLTEIFAGMAADMPTHLCMEDQARFAIGYYHQRQALFTKSTTEISKG